MSPGDREQELLRYIAQSMGRIEQYTRNGRDSFLAEPVLQDAVVRRLETLADAAGRLSATLKERHPQIPWRDIAGFRNVAAHGYLELDSVASQRVLPRARVIDPMAT